MKHFKSYDFSVSFAMDPNYFFSKHLHNEEIFVTTLKKAIDINYSIDI
jgi:hypothetical protein